MPTTEEIPITPTNTVSSKKVRTGDWKTYYPKLDPEKCIKCYICWKFCPDVSVVVKDTESFPEFDLDHCKGCGICAHECPKDAIEMILEE
jgi:2-oxoacid:acceptor oxidoreductase delta subunit (pyruvate/2-ketoisovalerate family)